MRITGYPVDACCLFLCYMSHRSTETVIRMLLHILVFAVYKFCTFPALLQLQMNSDHPAFIITASQPPPPHWAAAPSVDTGVRDDERSVCVMKAGGGGADMFPFKSPPPPHPTHEPWVDSGPVALLLDWL